MATLDIGAVQSDGALDIGAVQAAAAVGANAPTGHLAGSLWGSLAGPILSLLIILFRLVKGPI